MITDYKIFVEGVADKRFISQLLENRCDIDVDLDKIIKVDGWTKLLNSNLYATQIQQTSDNGGVNLVVFDADDDFETRKHQLLEWKNDNGLNFELFLFPNNHDVGELEDLLEQIINPQNQPVMDVWYSYEQKLKSVELPWRNGRPLTVPAKKTKIYAYLEVLLGKSRSQKDKIKEANRDYAKAEHWNLRAEQLDKLLSFLKTNLQI